MLMSTSIIHTYTDSRGTGSFSVANQVPIRLHLPVYKLSLVTIANSYVLQTNIMRLRAGSLSHLFPDGVQKGQELVMTREMRVIPSMVGSEKKRTNLFLLVDPENFVLVRKHKDSRRTSVAMIDTMVSLAHQEPAKVVDLVLLFFDVLFCCFIIFVAHTTSS